MINFIIHTFFFIHIDFTRNWHYFSIKQLSGVCVCVWERNRKERDWNGERKTHTRICFSLCCCWKVNNYPERQFHICRTLAKLCVCESMCVQLHSTELYIPFKWTHCAFSAKKKVSKEFFWNTLYYLKYFLIAL